MKQLKYSMPARFLAVLLAVLSAVAAVAGSFTAFVIYETGLYDSPLEDVISRNFQSLQEFYSVNLYMNKAKPDCLKDTNLEYGIIKGDATANLYLSPKTKYDYYNFNTFPKRDALVTSFYENQVECNNPNPTFFESLFNQYDYHYYTGTEEDYYAAAEDERDTPDEDGKRQAYLKDILYDEQNKIFYYKTSDYIIPVYHISVHSAYAVRKEVTAADMLEKETTPVYASFTLNTKSMQYLSDSDLYKPLDTTKYPNWQKFTTQPNYYWFESDDVQILSASDLPFIINMKNKHVWLTRDLTNDFSLKYYVNYYTQDITFPDKTFCIISQIAEPLDMQKNDLFVQQKKALTFLYNIRITCLAIAACGFVCFLLLLAFCCYSTGSNTESAFVPIHWLHRFPLLFYLAAIGSCIGGLTVSMAWCIDKIIHSNRNGILFIFLCLLSLSLAALLLVLAAMNVSRRHKAGILWKSSLSCHVLSVSRRLAAIGRTGMRYILQLFQEHTPLIGKGILIFGAIIFIEAMFFLMEMTSENKIFFFLWLVFKITEFIVMLAVLLQMKQLQAESRFLANGNLEHKLNTSRMFWEFKNHGECLNQIGDGMTIALEERMKSEHFRTELITNVSHDIKTPLTSIINYIDLLQKENLSPETAKEYLEVLERQSARLKKLIEDLMDASKASTGNLTVNLEKCDIDILLTQTIGEFEEKLSLNQLELISQSPDMPIFILADNRHLWRIFENLMNNICKYAQPGTRVYINWEADENNVCIIFRNISKYALTISGEYLLERFVRGDASRNTEGNGLGLSIAQSLAELMDATLEIVTDGDLFKVILTFPREM